MAPSHRIIALWVHPLRYWGLLGGFLLVFTANQTYSDEILSPIGVMDYDEAYTMQLTPGVVYNFPKTVGV